MKAMNLIWGKFKILVKKQAEGKKQKTFAIYMPKSITRLNKYIILKFLLKTPNHSI